MNTPTTPSPALSVDRSSPDRAILAWLDRRRGYLFAGIALLYAVGFSTYWRIGPDSALYMVIGRHLAEGNGYTYAGQHHTLVYPMLPWLLAGIWRLFGESIAAANAAMWLLVVGGLAFWYRALALRFGRPTAVASIVMVALAEVVFRYAFQILTEPLFFFGVGAVMAAYEGLRADEPHRRSIVLNFLLLAGGLFVVIAARPTMYGLVGALGVAGAWHAAFGPRRLVHVGIIVATCACLLVFVSVDPRRVAPASAVTGSTNYEAAAASTLANPSRIAGHVLTESLPMWFDAHACEALLGIELGVPLSWVVGLAAMVIGVWAFRWRVLWGAYFGLTAAMMLAFDPVVRYFMPIIPFIAPGWLLFACWLLRRRGPYLHWLAVALLLLWVVPNAARVVGFVVDQRRGSFIEHSRDGLYAPFGELAARQRSRLEADAVVVTPHGRESAWLFDRDTVDSERVAEGLDRREFERLAGGERPVYVVAPLPDKTAELLRERFDLSGPMDAAGDLRLRRAVTSGSGDAPGPSTRQTGD